MNGLYQSAWISHRRLSLPHAFHGLHIEYASAIAGTAQYRTSSIIPLQEDMPNHCDHVALGGFIV